MILSVEGNLNQQQMIIDYYDLEKIINPIIQELDHSFMVNKSDTLVLEFLNKINSKKVVVDFDPTVESICNYILNKIKEAPLPENIKSLTVRIYETYSDYAKDKIELNK